jgi:hypothetical protein
VDHLNLDPEGLASISVRFTAPTSGTYGFTGDFLGDDKYQHAHPVEILVNGSSVYSNTINKYDQSDPFSIQATLTAGDTVDFAVETGPHGDFSYLRA